MKLTVPEFKNLKNKRKISALTAYDYTIAKIINDAGIDFILVGDSLASVVHGEDNTIGVTMEDMIYHAKHVSKACTDSLLSVDMPYMSFQESNELALRNASRLMQEGRSDSVKIEGGANVAERIETLTKYDIPVVGHVGLTPQSYHKLGGHKRQGIDQKSVNDSKKIINDAYAVAEAGAFAIVLECIPEDLAKEITSLLSIPTIGIGAGHYCDGQIAVTYDILGLSEKIPSFVEVGKENRSNLIDLIHQFKTIH